MTDRICIIEECGRLLYGRGWCAKHYQRWRKYGDPLGVTQRTQFVTIGQRFGRWVVTGPEVVVCQTVRNPRGHRAAPVKCSCPRGKEKVVTFSDLFGGRSQSCGCLRGEALGRKNQETNPAITHGLTGHVLFYTWQGILKRCDNPANKDYKNYGGRGIAVCTEWRDLTAFIAWIEANLGPRPTGMTLDRCDPDGNYEPGNVRWATALQQRHNRRLPRPSAAAAPITVA